MQANLPFLFRTGNDQAQSVLKYGNVRRSTETAFYGENHYPKTQSLFRRGQQNRCYRPDKCGNDHRSRILFSKIEWRSLCLAAFDRKHRCDTYHGKIRFPSTIRYQNPLERQKRRRMFCPPSFQVGKAVPFLWEKARLAVDHLFENDLLRCVQQIVHQPHPFHLIVGFQFLRHSLGFRHVFHDLFDLCPR